MGKIIFVDHTGDDFEDIRNQLERVSKIYDGSPKERCEWMCPLCGLQCSGIKGHKSYHQCPTHYVTGEK